LTLARIRLPESTDKVESTPRLIGEDITFVLLKDNVTLTLAIIHQ
jgi:hypothetical protein